MNLLLATLLLTQEQSATEIFSRIDEILRAAKTIRIKVAAEGSMKTSGAEAPYSVSGELVLGGGNRVFRQLVLNERGTEYQLTLVCDGTRRLSKRDPNPAKVTDARKDLGLQLTAVIMRCGVVYATWLGDDRPQDFAKAFAVSEIKFGPEAKTCKSLSYQVFVPVLKKNAVVLLWYDPGTFRIVHRKMTLTNEASEEHILESYGEFTLGGEVPDGKFKLPADEK